MTPNDAQKLARDVTDEHNAATTILRFKVHMTRGGTPKEAEDICTRHGAICDGQTYEDGYPVYGRGTEAQVEAIRRDPDVMLVEVLSPSR